MTLLSQCNKNKNPHLNFQGWEGTRCLKGGGVKEKKIIAGKEGWYVEKYDLVDKYVRRDKKCLEADEVCVVQFYRMFSATHQEKQNNANYDCDDEIEEDVEGFIPELEAEIKGKFHYVMTASQGNPIPLPDYITLENTYPGEPSFMKKGTNQQL